MAPAGSCALQLPTRCVQPDRLDASRRGTRMFPAHPSLTRLRPCQYGFDIARKAAARQRRALPSAARGQGFAIATSRNIIILD